MRWLRVWISRVSGFCTSVPVARVPGQLQRFSEWVLLAVFFALGLWGGTLVIAGSCQLGLAFSPQGFGTIQGGGCGSGTGFACTRNVRVTHRSSLIDKACNATVAKKGTVFWRVVHDAGVGELASGC